MTLNVLNIVTSSVFLLNRLIMRFLKNVYYSSMNNMVKW